MDIIARIAEEKIREAIRKGELESLSYKGKRVKVEDLSRVPAELRPGYIMLKNAGVLPEELQLKKEIVNLERLLECCYEEDKRRSIKKDLNEKTLRFNMLMEKKGRGRCSTVEAYRSKIHSRLSRG